MILTCLTGTIRVTGKHLLQPSSAMLKCSYLLHIPLPLLPLCFTLQHLQVLATSKRRPRHCPCCCPRDQVRCCSGGVLPKVHHPSAQHQRSASDSLASTRYFVGLCVHLLPYSTLITFLQSCASPTPPQTGIASVFSCVIAWCAVVPLGDLTLLLPVT
jgi:hypothetical protein